MKNKTIQILAEGRWVLPIGAKMRHHESRHNVWHTPAPNSAIVINELNEGRYNEVIEVDFKELPPLYPHKSMIVTEEGIEFAKWNGKLVMVGDYGMGYLYEGEENLHRWSNVIGQKTFELKRTLPKTKTVCAGCHKEVCECVRAEGWYRVKREFRWELQYWGGHIFRTCKRKDDTGNSYWTLDSMQEIDWENPINVTPESEATNEK